MMKKCIFTLCLIMVSGFLSAQSVDRKIIVKMGKSRHLYANLILQNKLPMRGMIESGVPVLVLDSTFLFTHLDDLNISLVESKATLNLAGNKYKCTHITNDTIFVNGLFYKGKTVIANMASKKIDIMYPIHLFGDLNDANSKIMELNISSKYMMPLTRQELELKKSKYKKYPMRNDGYGNMYAIDSELKVASNSKYYYSLEGDFLLDLGNASFLFLLEQHPAYKEFINNSNIELRQGNDNQGRKIPVKGFLAKKCYMADVPFYDVTIAITPQLPKFTTVGVLGLKFFEKFNVIFDFGEKILYLK